MGLIWVCSGKGNGGSNFGDVPGLALHAGHVSAENSGFNPVFNHLELPSGDTKPRSTVPSPREPSRPVPKEGSRGRVNLQRQTAHRGGKTVTVISGFVGIGLPEKERLAKAIQQACGTGGTVKEGRIEIQGDRRDVAARILTEAGFSPVNTGG